MTGRRPRQQTKVVSIVGPGRSGTTLLGSILGHVEGFFCVGELRWLWRRGLREGRHCGCGTPVKSCPLWSQVVAEAGEAPDVVAAWQDDVSRLRMRTRAIRAARDEQVSWPALEQYTALISRMYRLIGEATGARVVVDTSKRPQDAAVLARVPSVDHYVIHVVRDPRAVAYSWTRVKKVPEGIGEHPMAQMRPLGSAVRWMENGVGAELLRRRFAAERWCSLRYEDFARQPRDWVDRLLAFLGEHSAANPMTGERSVNLQLCHTVAGNIDRFRTGEVTVVEDDEWRHRLPFRARLAVGTVTAPLLSRYGYGYRRPAVPPPPAAPTA
jgi:hypothetical protein